MNLKFIVLKFKKINVLSLIVLFSLSGKAQEAKDFFSLSYSSAIESKIKNDSTRMSFSSLETNLITPTINIGKRTKINNMFSYKFSEFDFKNKTDHYTQLSDIQYLLLIRHQINTRYSLIILPQFIIRSDFENSFGSHDIFPAVAAIFMNSLKRNDRFKLGYGISYSRDFLKNTITPLFAISYDSEKIHFNALLPNNIQLIITPNKVWEYGMVINLETAIYNSPSNIDFNAKYIRTFGVPVLFNTSRNISGMLWINAKAGMNIVKEYEVLDADFLTVKNQKRSVTPTPYISIGLSFKLKEK
nr:hypothetical protein [uncultured Flavobacterium sp.]